jgi:hypothetical protein
MCAEISRNRGENKRLVAAERGFEAKNKREDQCPPSCSLRECAINAGFVP